MNDRVELKNRLATADIKRVQKNIYSAKARACGYPANIKPIIREIQKSGISSLWAVADALNARGIRGARGGKWYATTVRKLLERN